MLSIKNKKAAECTAIHPTAISTNLGGFVDGSLAQNIDFEKFSISEASRLSGIELDLFIQFFILKGYIKKVHDGYTATALGIEKGCFVNDINLNAFITINGICKASSAFAA